MHASGLHICNGLKRGDGEFRECGGGGDGGCNWNFGRRFGGQDVGCGLGGGAGQRVIAGIGPSQADVGDGHLFVGAWVGVVKVRVCLGEADLVVGQQVAGMALHGGQGAAVGFFVVGGVVHADRAWIYHDLGL